jgi:linoleoyl-CoA desaturase
VNFAPRSRLLTWYLGGLNYQIEHHLFPKVCHIHYPALAPIVARVCREHGVRYYSHPTMRAALASHARWLYVMSRRPN